ncbi:serine hydrolase [Lyngbya confervoides]|uniref:Class A beta-lactamase-related serine hydrolase n=1 Tax=Lyngbya confervoides BDU141951 TaxID=1574623 RepID=A0ABD4SYM9_9CYAN|nr:serine hydrolase [Lyngbya confervoides]MCM1981412.1 class A beta-lactamase-related serine hydrolase [Lyngbya confervoides BDU141951]
MSKGQRRVNGADNVFLVCLYDLVKETAVSNSPDNHQYLRRRRRLVKRQGRSATTEAEKLRTERLKRFNKRRAALQRRQLKSRHGRPSVRSAASAQPRSAVLMGAAQPRRPRRPVEHRRSSYQGNRSAKPARPMPRSRRGSHRLGPLHLLRLLLSGLGVALLAGTAIAIFHPETEPVMTQAEFGAVQSLSQGEAPAGQAQGQQENTAETMPQVSFEAPGKELRQVKQEVEALAQAQEGLETGLFFLNPETQEYLSIRGSEAFPAASTIKLPILIAFFQEVDAGRVKLDEQLVMREDLKVGEAGSMQYSEVGSKYSALETADMMITISDNTATNMIMDRLGGNQVLNERFKSWGLEQTRINQPLPDLEGTNTISPKDLAILMMKVSQGDILTAHSRDRALEILRNTVTDTLLPQGLEPGAQIAHKTGDIGSAVGDAGLIDMPNGQRYVAGIMVKRPHNDPRAQELIRNISRLTYQAFSKTQP